VARPPPLSAALAQPWHDDLIPGAEGLVEAPKEPTVDEKPPEEEVEF